MRPQRHAIEPARKRNKSEKEKEQRIKLARCDVLLLGGQWGRFRRSQKSFENLSKLAAAISHLEVESQGAGYQEFFRALKITP
jgi:hypothetical protein